MITKGNYTNNQTITGGSTGDPMQFNPSTKEWEPYTFAYTVDFGLEKLPGGLKVGTTTIGHGGIVKGFSGLGAYIGQHIYADIQTPGTFTTEKYSMIHLGYVMATDTIYVDIRKEVPCGSRISIASNLSGDIPDGDILQYNSSTNIWESSEGVSAAIKVKDNVLLHLGHSPCDISGSIVDVDTDAFQLVYQNIDDTSKLRVYGSGADVLLETISIIGTSDNNYLTVLSDIVNSLVGLNAYIKIVGGDDDGSEYEIDYYTPGTYPEDHKLYLSSNLNNNTLFKSYLWLNQWNVSVNDTEETTTTDLTGIPAANQFVHDSFKDTYHKVTDIEVIAESPDIVTFTPPSRTDLTGSFKMYETHTAEIYVRKKILGFYVKNYGFYFEGKN